MRFQAFNLIVILLKHSIKKGGLQGVHYREDERAVHVGGVDVVGVGLIVFNFVVLKRLIENIFYGECLEPGKFDEIDFNIL